MMKVSPAREYAVALLTVAISTTLWAQERIGAVSKQPDSRVAAAVTNEKDIDPFTGQSLSEAQLRRTLEREKLITAIASEKTKQTQNNSELTMAKLRNAAERARLATEVKTMPPVPVPVPSRPGAGPSAGNRKSATTTGSAQAAAVDAMPDRPLEALSAQHHQPPALLAARPSRAEIRFHDELIEIKSGTASRPSVIASVDAQRPTGDTKSPPRPINPIGVTPATLPPAIPQTSSFLMSPQ